MGVVPVIVGAGLAGLSLALSLAPYPVLVMGRKPSQRQTSSELAQGGIAAAIGMGDTPSFHALDTMTAGAGYCDRQAVEQITSAAPSVIKQLQEWGVCFDKDSSGALVLGLEGAHSHRRIVHAQGDSTGAVIMQALVKKVKETPSITLIEGEALRIETDHQGEVSGLTYRDLRKKTNYTLATDQVILATGSTAALWQHTTVPTASWGSGLILASDVGARLRDLEFAQFHPTALDVGLDPMPLVSEAVRGEGARLVNKMGQEFVKPLAPRDSVARAVWSQLDSGAGAFLDARMIANFKTRFPTVTKSCVQGGIDPSSGLIPVKPATHYHMGGIETNLYGQTNIRGLWASGECACTGLHGGNRLASNSLLESVAMGQKISDALKQQLDVGGVVKRAVSSDLTYHRDTAENIKCTREILSRYVGVCRSQIGLGKAINLLTDLAKTTRRACVALLIAKAALARTQSCGAHERIDENKNEQQLAS